MKTNEQLQRDVLDELAWEPSIDAAAIGVSAHDGIITLRGNVGSYAQMYAAEKAAKRVRGVQGLANEMKVKFPVSFKRDDTDLAAMAVSALRNNIFVPADAVKVSVEDGWIYLEGTVDWQFQKEHAAKAVRYLPGVRGLGNNINVKPRVNIQAIADDIHAALKRRAELEADGITVKVDGDKVTLSGTVRSWSEKRAAENAAWSTKGVREVDSKLTINTYAFA
jgi:osmotically-inducible protein OsmY